MKIRPIYLLLTAIILLVASLFVHFLIFKGITAIPSFVDISLTTGMVIAWLLSSKFLKELHQTEPDVHPLKLITQNVPNGLLFLTAFFFLYAIVNMGMMIRTNWQGSNLRGVSGFWLFFYALAIMVSWARLNQRRLRSDKKLNEE